MNARGTVRTESSFRRSTRVIQELPLLYSAIIYLLYASPKTIFLDSLRNIRLFKK